MNIILDVPLDIQWIKRFLLPAADIFIIAFVIYRIYTMISGTRAMQVVKGLALIVVAAWVSQFLHLETVSWLLKQLIQVSVIAIIILFQPELRRILTTLGQNRLLGFLLRERINVIDVLADAVEELSNNKIGAIIAIEARVGLKNYIETGVKLDAIIGKDIFISIFKKDSPLHDGAVVVRGDRIVAARCILPLTERHELLEGYGTRHHAALGLSEESDAFVIVVSEETGKISVAHNGRMDMGISIKRLKERLENFYR